MRMPYLYRNCLFRAALGVIQCNVISIEKVGALELDLKVNNCCLVSES